MPSVDPLYVTPPKAARMIGIGRTKVYELIRDGRLPATLLDGRYLIKVADIRKFMESLPETVGIGRTKVYELIRNKRRRSNEVGPKGARSAD
jgi:excisionase family DNA binding protein